MSDPIALDSVTHLTAAHAGRAVYCASHGGAYAAAYAAGQGVGAVILSDAGVGRAGAGIAGLALLDRLGVPAAAIAHSSARIGDGADGIARGKIAHANGAAQRLGVSVGLSCREALARLASAALTPAPRPPKLEEARFEIAPAGPHRRRVVGMDSVALVSAEDAGQVIVTASHGGLLGGKPATAVKVDVFAALYNDAGIGIDDAGLSRLPALDARGIAGATVDCMSAAIGDARSTYADGIVSAVNETALRLGARPGQTARDFVDVMAAVRPTAGR